MSSIKFGVLAFDFGRPISTPVNSHSINCYKYIGARFGATEDPLLTDTVPISWRISSDANYSLILDDITDKLGKLARLELLIVDLTHCKHRGLTLQGQRSVRSTVIDTVNQYLVAGDSENKPLIFIISTEAIDFDFGYRELRNALNGGNIINVSLEGDLQVPDKYYVAGETYHAVRFRNDFSFKDFSNLWMPIDELKQRISQRIVKHPGIFEYIDLDGSSKIEPYNFDASECADEIKRYLSGIISSHPRIYEKPIHIFCFKETSHWFERDILPSLSVKLDKLLKSGEALPDIIIKELVGDIEQFEKLLDELPSDADVFIFVPFVGTGRTMQKIFEVCKTKQKISFIHFITVIQRQGFLDSTIREAIDKSSSYTAMCVVDDNHSNSSIVSRMSALGHSKMLEKVRLDTKKIPGDLFWLMSLECGIRPENHTPNHRNSINFITNYVKMIEKFTPYLIKLIGNCIKNSETPLLVCIDEKTNPSELKFSDTDACQAICSTFSAIRGDSHLIVPRIVLASLADIDTFQVLSNQYSQEEWFISLNKFKEVIGLKAVVFDEFRKSGKSINQLKKLLNLAKIDIATSIVLMDFDPRTRPDTDHTLYEIEAVGLN